MPESILSGCDESCGWIAAGVAAIAYGSYGVPVKQASLTVDVNPLVMQTYKTLVFFLTCWIVILLGEDIRFTPWGILSGIIWVPGGVCGIYAIRACGMAAAIGTWASLCVIMNFIWGILVFEEGVKSFMGTCGAFILLVVGLIGMSNTLDPPKEKIVQRTSSTSSLPTVAKRKQEASPLVVASRKRTIRKRVSFDIEENLTDSMSESDDENDEKGAAADRLLFLGGRVALTTRQCGILGAVVNGVWGGTTLIPMHYASEAGIRGAAFLVSFACGSLLVNAIIWLGLFLYHYHRKSCWKKALGALPPFHLQQLWYAGGLSGVLFSIGMIGSMLAVWFLGQGVGNSFVESQILVSGLWGIFYYKEITAKDIIFKWFLAAAISMMGILWLSFEHQSIPRQKLHGI